MNKKYYIFGASGHAKVVIDVIHSTLIKLEGIIDDDPKVKFLSAIEVFHTNEIQITDECQILVAIGSNQIRKKIVDQNSYHYFSAIHQSSFVSMYAIVEEGTVVMPKAIINYGAKVGKHCIINSGAVVEHDCIIEDYVHVSPNAALAGNVFVGEGTHIGIGASVIQGVKIGKWVTIGAGAVVLKDVPDYAVAVGNPAKIIRFNP